MRSFRGPVIIQTELYILVLRGDSEYFQLRGASTSSARVGGSDRDSQAHNRIDGLVSCGQKIHAGCGSIPWNVAITQDIVTGWVRLSFVAFTNVESLYFTDVFSRAIFGSEVSKVPDCRRRITAGNLALFSPFGCARRTYYYSFDLVLFPFNNLMATYAKMFIMQWERRDEAQVV